MLAPSSHPCTPGHAALLGQHWQLIQAQFLQDFLKPRCVLLLPFVPWGSRGAV